jgi:hypothetical protein
MLAGAILAAIVTLVLAANANAQEFHAKFSGFNEVGALNAETGAIFSQGQATLALNLNKQLQSLNYTLIYSNLVSVLQAISISAKCMCPEVPPAPVCVRARSR